MYMHVYMEVQLESCLLLLIEKKFKCVCFTCLSGKWYLVPQKIPHIPEVEANNKHVGREYDSLAA